MENLLNKLGMRMDTKLDQFIDSEREYLLESLRQVVASAQRQMAADPDEYTEFGADDPSIDVRLCVDIESHGGPNWIFRIGLVDYDPYFSEYCGAGCITLDTKAEDLLDELIDQLES